MKKTILTLTALAGFLTLSQTASAALFDYKDYKDIDVVQIVLDSENRSASGVLDIVNDDGDDPLWDRYGFDNTKEIITNAQIVFGFREAVGVDLTIVRFGIGDLFVSVGGSEVSGDIIDGVVTTDILFGSGLVSNLIVNLQADGQIEWDVALTEDPGNGSVKLYGVGLGVEILEVPDSANTFALLGFSTLGLALISRRFK